MPIGVCYLKKKNTRFHGSDFIKAKLTSAFETDPTFQEAIDNDNQSLSGNGNQNAANFNPRQAYARALGNP